MVWRLQYAPKGDWFYVYLLIEFQSRVDRFMAIRILAYIMLLYENLIRHKRLTSTDKLPPVIPIVLYNGLRPWTAPLKTAELIEGLPSFERFLPDFEYQVIDEGHLPRHELEPLDSAVAGVFQLEQSKGLEEIRRIIDTLLVLLDDPELWELRRDMATWLRRAVLPARLPGVDLPELHDLQEAKNMLEERAATWPDQWMAQGYRKGRQEGLEKGRQEGLEKGLEKGRQEGLRETLMLLAEAKFGGLTTGDKRLISRAPRAQLQSWLQSILKAKTAKELFRS